MCIHVSAALPRGHVGYRRSDSRPDTPEGPRLVKEPKPTGRLRGTPPRTPTTAAGGKQAAGALWDRSPPGVLQPAAQVFPHLRSVYPPPPLSRCSGVSWRGPSSAPWLPWRIKGSRAAGTAAWPCLKRCGGLSFSLRSSRPAGADNTPHRVKRCHRRLHPISTSALEARCTNQTTVSGQGQPIATQMTRIFLASSL